MRLARSTSLHLALATLAPSGCVADSLPVGSIEDPTVADSGTGTSTGSGTGTETDAGSGTLGGTGGIEPPQEHDEGNSESSSEGNGDDPGDTDDQPAVHEDPECMMTIPDIDATTSVEIGDWPVANPFDFQIYATCSVDAMVEDGATVETTMTCNDAGIERPLVVTTAAPTTTPAWSVDQIVTMYYSYYDYDRGVFNTSLSLHRADDGALLLAAYEGSEGETEVFDPILVAPLTVTLDYEHCAWLNEDFVPHPILMTFTNEEGDSLGVLGGSAGRLPGDEGIDAIEIAVAEALTGWKGESAHTFQFLLQRKLWPR